MLVWKDLSKKEVRNRGDERLETGTRKIQRALKRLENAKLK